MWYRVVMRGSLKETSPGVWRVRYDAGTDPATGKRLQRNATVHGGKRAAEARLRTLLAEADKPVGSRMTLGALLAEHVAHGRRVGLAPTTIAGRQRIGERLPPWLAAKPISDVSGADLDRFYGQLSAQGTGAPMIQAFHVAIKAAYSQALKWGYVQTNPAMRATPPRVRRATVAVPDLSDVQAMVEAAAASRQPEMATVITTLVLTGMRRGELCALRWSDVDWDRGRLRVEHSVWQEGRAYGVKATKTSTVRYLALDELTAGILAARRERAEAQAAQAETTIGPASYVFSPEPGGTVPLMPDNVTHVVGDLAKNLGLDIHTHTFRHFAITTLIGSGVDARTVAGRAGHSDPSMTLRVYSGYLAQRDLAAANILGALMAPTTGDGLRADTAG